MISIEELPCEILLLIFVIGCTSTSVRPLACADVPTANEMATIDKLVRNRHFIKNTPLIVDRITSLFID